MPRGRPGRQPRCQPPEGDRAPRSQLARGVAAEAVPHLVLDLAEGLLHKVQWVLLPRDALAPSAPARALAQGGRRLERAPHRARPGWAAARFQMARVKTWVTHGRRATRANQSSRSYRVCITGETR